MDGASSETNCSIRGKNDLAINVDDIFQNLQQQAKFLFAKEEDVNRGIANTQETVSKTCECANWLDDVKKMKQDLKDLQERYQVAREQGQGLANLSNLMKLIEEMIKKTDAIVLLNDRMKPETILSTDNNRAMVEKKFGKEMIDMKTFHDFVQKMLGYLKDDDVRSIGIWGMAGVGKTTIMEILNDEVEKHGMFDIVIWVTVSKEGTVGKIQRAIVNRMKLNVDGIKCDYHMTSIVCKALEKKKYLILMDEVFSEVDLRAVGILDTHVHGKLVVATRYRSVCHLMDVDEDIKVERMCRGDAWKLFRKIVGEAVDHPVIRPIAERVLKECGELPQLIKVVARMLRNNFSEDVWLRILSKLQSPTDHQLQPLEEVLDIFRLVYDGLDDNLKQCLLYLASFPEDHEISREYLIECWKAEELIRNAQMFSKARQEGHILLEDLIDRYFLDRCKEVEYVKMPLIFRNMALRIANANDNWILLLRAQEKLDYPPVEQWRGARVISLMSSNLHCLPARPESCEVSTLLLQKNELLTKIPPSFFDFMTCLKVLNLCGTGIRSLPESISNLTSLRGLYLNDCRQLAVLPKQIAELKSLEVFEMWQTGLRGLPTYIGELTHLQCLKISFMSCTCHDDDIEALDVDMIPANVIKSLSLLQELTIDVDPLYTRWNRVAPVIAKEVATLTMLNSLSFYFPSLECFEAFIRSSISWNNSLFPLLHDKFRSFKFSVGPHVNRLRQLDASKCLAKRHLKYSGGNSIPNIMKEVLKRVRVFEMIGHESVKNLSDFGVDVMEWLEICIIEGCDKLEKVVGPDNLMTAVFPCLKELHLLKLQQFHCIWDGAVMPRSFSKLTAVTIFDCPNAKKLLSIGMSKHLQELQYLRIEKCSQITEIITADLHPGERATMFGILPSLKTLELVDLRRLIRICADDLLEWPSLQSVEVIACEVLAGLPFNGRNAVQLQSICCSKDWWRTLMVQREVKAQLQQLCRFI